VYRISTVAQISKWIQGSSPNGWIITNLLPQANGSNKDNITKLFQQQQQLQISSSSIHYSFIYTADIIRFFSSLFVFQQEIMAFLIGSLMERARKTLVVKINDHPFPEIFRFLGN
jgi:hypothetical protein